MAVTDTLSRDVHRESAAGPKPLLELVNVSLTYPVLSVNARSIRHVLLNTMTGGKMLRDARDVVHVQALDGVSLRLHEGDRLGIVGHNGSGKTTLLKVIAGIYEPSAGLVLASGTISSMIDLGTGIDTDATGVENIKLVGRLRGFSEKVIKSQIEEIATFADLGSFIDLPVRTYSAGMMMRLLFSISTCFSPEILVLDEWLGAGDAGFIKKAEARMDQFVSSSKLLVIATHNHHLLRRVCNKILHLEGGKVVFFGDVNDWDGA
jgi:ABC-type polysaccharide/polyol phosphate transport system ATPase subunit